MGARFPDCHRLCGPGCLRDSRAVAPSAAGQRPTLFRKGSNGWPFEQRHRGGPQRWLERGARAVPSQSTRARRHGESGAFPRGRRRTLRTGVAVRQAQAPPIWCFQVRHSRHRDTVSLRLFRTEIRAPAALAVLRRAVGRTRVVRVSEGNNVRFRVERLWHFAGMGSASQWWRAKFVEESLGAPCASHRSPRDLRGKSRGAAEARRDTRSEFQRTTPCTRRLAGENGLRPPPQVRARTLSDWCYADSRKVGWRDQMISAHALYALFPQR